MSSFKPLDPQQRQKNAIETKRKMLEKFRKASQAPEVAARDAVRVTVNEARAARAAKRDAANKDQVEQAARDAEAASHAQREEEEAQALIAAEKANRDVLLKVEAKAARDLRYAARKARKK